MPKPQDMIDALNHPEVHYKGEVIQVYSMPNFAKTYRRRIMAECYNV